MNEREQIEAKETFHGIVAPAWANDLESLRYCGLRPTMKVMDILRPCGSPTVIAPCSSRRRRPDAANARADEAEERRMDAAGM